MSKPLLLTLGDPNGLGPELVCRLLPSITPTRPVVLIGPELSLQPHMARLKLKPFCEVLEDEDDFAGLSPGYYLLPPEGTDDIVISPGVPGPSGGRAAGLSLGLAADLVMGGQADGLVTCPLDKAMLMAAEFDFPGHTEFLADRAGLKFDDVTMHLCGPKLRVSLVTTHPPLKNVAGLITIPRVERALRHTRGFVAKLGLTAPIAVCGLNPHAGESGRIGTEEIDFIVPAMEAVRAEEGVDIAGPFPADTIFHRALEGEFSAVVAMYHDQGLGPLKLVHFGQSVNVTLGLPFVRTSVDHGTGYDLVGKDEARTDSLRMALDLAEKLL